MRPDWDMYFMRMALVVSSRATCDRKHVGCVITRDNRIVSTGYNGSMSGIEHCDEIGHDMEDTHCQRTIHAEANAIAEAAKRGVATNRSTAYVTAMPCWLCFKLLVQSGIRRIVYLEQYRIEDTGAQRVVATAAKLNIPLVHMQEFSC